MRKTNVGMFTLFIIGTPCSGKSLVARLLLQFFRKSKPYITVQHLDDFHIFWEMVEHDDTYSRHKITDDGGIKITDKSFWRDLNEAVVKKVKGKESKIDILLLEFARKNYTDTLKMFPDSILVKSLVLYVDCPFDVAWQRNISRGTTSKVRYISRSEMETTFKTNDFQNIERELDVSVIVVRTDIINKAALQQELNRTIIPLLLKRIVGVSS